MGLLCEDLIIQKAVAGRGRDWPDIEALLIEQRKKMDDAYIEDWLTQFAEILEKPDILEEYKQFQKKFKILASNFRNLNSPATISQCLRVSSLFVYHNPVPDPSQSSQPKNT